MKAGDVARCKTCGIIAHMWETGVTTASDLRCYDCALVASLQALQEREKLDKQR